MLYLTKVRTGIYSNLILHTIPFQTLTDKQFDFLKLFFNDYDKPAQFFDPNLSFNKNPLLSNRKKYQSLEELKSVMETARKTTISRGSINGFVQKLSESSALTIYPNPTNKKEKSIEISYFGMAYFLHALFQKQFDG